MVYLTCDYVPFCNVAALAMGFSVGLVRVLFFVDGCADCSRGMVGVDCGGVVAVGVFVWWILLHFG